MARKRKREAAAPRQAANADLAPPEAMENASFSSPDLERNPCVEERQDDVIDRILSEVAKTKVEFQKVMKEFERQKAEKEALVQEVKKLESDKAKKESQVQNMTKDIAMVMKENVRLHGMLDKKEAQLLAMSEQVKSLMGQLPSP